MGRFYPTVEDAFLDQIEFGEGCWIWTGSTNRKTGQALLQCGDYKGRAYCYAYERFVGPIPSGMEIDHQCRKPSCVRPSHLRAVTHAVNLQNLGLQKSNTSGYRGVSWCKSAKKWRAYAKKDGKQTIAGYFDSAEDANYAAIALRNRLFVNNVGDRASSSAPKTS